MEKKTYTERKGDENFKELIRKGFMTAGEVRRLKAQRAYEAIDRGTISAKVLLNSDEVRRAVTAVKITIDKAFADIKNFINQARKLKVEITSGLIKEELKPGMPLTEDEAKVMVMYAENSAWTHANDIILELNKLRSFVGLHDVGSNVIIMEEAFDEYVKEVDIKLHELGYSLFDEVASI